MRLPWKRICRHNWQAKRAARYFAFLRVIHSAIAVRNPSMNRGNIHSLDAPTAHARIANPQQEATTQSAMDRVSGRFAICAPCRVLVRRSDSCQASARGHQPEGAQRGTPSPDQRHPYPTNKRVPTRLTIPLSGPPDLAPGDLPCSYMRANIQSGPRPHIECLFAPIEAAFSRGVCA